MKKKWSIMLLVASLSGGLPVQANTNKISVVYNGVQLKLNKEPVARFGKVWLPARELSYNMGYSISYDKQENIVYISKENRGEFGFRVVQAGSKEDTGHSPILLEGTVYLSVRDVTENFLKEVAWDAKTKTVNISSTVSIDIDSEGGLKYNTENGDFYNGNMLIAHLPFKYIDWISAEKQKTVNNHVIYSVSNAYGEPHINDELYTVYVVNGGLHVAESFKRNVNGSNYLIQDNKVVLINKNEISVYDDITGNLIKRHTISTKPLKEYMATLEYDDENASKGYLVEGVGDDFVLYRNYLLKTLTLVNLNNDQETTLYKQVYPESELPTEASLRAEGDYLRFVKAEKGIIYLKHVYTDETYTYKYEL